MSHRFPAALALAALAVIASGCYVSLHPLVSQDVQVYEPALVGSWEEKDAGSKDVWVFKPQPGDTPEGYIVEVTEQYSEPLFGPVRPLTATFEGRLGRFGDVLVLEVAPDCKSTLGPLKNHGLLTSSLIAAQSFFRVRLAGDSLTLNAVDGKWMDKAIAAKTITIAHEHVGDEPNPHEAGQKDLHAERRGPEGENWVLLTAPTSALQSLVRGYAKRGLFNEKDAGEFVRVK